MFQPRPRFIALMVVYTVLARLTPWILWKNGMDIDPETTVYPWNFSPLMAICLYGAANYKNRQWAFLIPLGALFLSDLGILAITEKLSWAFYPSQVFVYGCFALSIGMGMLLRKQRSALKITGTALVSEVIFFIVTNFGVWAFGSFYTPNAAGLVLCYTAAIPFFKLSLISTAVFTTLMFSPLGVKQEILVSAPEADGLQPVPVPVNK